MEVIQEKKRQRLTTEQRLERIEDTISKFIQVYNHNQTIENDTTPNVISFSSMDFGLSVSARDNIKSVDKTFNQNLNRLIKHHKVDLKGL